ncbi:MAG: hypothetical protein RLZZ292_1411, partial [Bacteroidota bacterium]
MIKSITIENFFSFGKSEKITLNSGTNILVGINASGKSNFIKAIKLLYEGVAGDGLEKLMNENWSGFESIVNFGDSKIDTVRIGYCFDKDVLNSFIDNQLFLLDPYYFIQIIK